MKKDLLMLHARLYRIRHALVTQELVPVEAFAAYDELDVTPLRLDRDRLTHARAVQELVACMERAFGVEKTTIAAIAGIREK